MLFVSSLWTVDSFTGNLVHTWTLNNFKTLFSVSTYRTIALRTIGIAAAVTVTDAILALPFAFFAVRIASKRLQGVLFVAVLIRTIRRPTPAHIDMTLFFGAVAVLIVLSSIASRLHLAQPEWLATDISGASLRCRRHSVMNTSNSDSSMASASIGAIASPATSAQQDRCARPRTT